MDIASPELEETIEVVKVLERNQILVFAEQLAQPEISFSERLDIAEQLRALFGAIQEHAPPRAKQLMKPDKWPKGHVGLKKFSLQCR